MHLGGSFLTNLRYFNDLIQSLYPLDAPVLPYLTNEGLIQRQNPVDKNMIKVNKITRCWMFVPVIF